MHEHFITELKAVERITNARKRQMPTCLRLTGMHLGFILDFVQALVKSGHMRTVDVLKEWNMAPLRTWQLCGTTGSDKAIRADAFGAADT